MLAYIDTTGELTCQSSWVGCIQKNCGDVMCKYAGARDPPRGRAAPRPHVHAALVRHGYCSERSGAVTEATSGERLV